MIAAFLPFLAGPLGRALMWGALAAAVIGGAVFTVHQHDRRVLAEQAAREATAVAARQMADMRAALAASEAEAKAAVARAEAASTIKQEIANAPLSGECVPFDPLGAALDGLRRAAGAGGGSPDSAPGPPVVPAPAGHSRHP